MKENASTNVVSLGETHFRITSSDARNIRFKYMDGNASNSFCASDGHYYRKIHDLPAKYIEKCEKTLLRPSKITQKLNSINMMSRKIIRHLCGTSTMFCHVNKSSGAVFNQVVRKYTPRRAMMYIPGDDERKLKKGISLDVDCIAMDCEDGVAINKKAVARDTIRKLLNTGKSSTKCPEWSVRLNSVESGLCEEDLAAIVGAKNVPPTLHLPKVDSVEHLEWFSDKLGSEVQKRDDSPKFNLIIFIESARAVMDLPSICRKAVELAAKPECHFSPVALVFGSDDLCADIGATRSKSSEEILYARQRLVLTAKAFRLQAIDVVYIDYKDLEGLREQSELGARMGYTGKQVIHPSQVPVVQEAFLPSPLAVEWAKGLVKAFEEHQKLGKGAFTYKGSMIDMPLLLQAQNIIELHNSVQR